MTLLSLVGLFSNALTDRELILTKTMRRLTVLLDFAWFYKIIYLLSAGFWEVEATINCI